MLQVIWQKSSYSDGAGNNCLELAAAQGSVLIRESDAPGAVLATAPGPLGALLAAIATGEFNRTG